MKASALSKEVEVGRAPETRRASATADVSGPSREVLGQPATDLIEHETHKRLRPADVGRWHHEMERRGFLSPDEIRDPPIAAGSDGRDDGIAIQAEE